MNAHRTKIIELRAVSVYRGKARIFAIGEIPVGISRLCGFRAGSLTVPNECLSGTEEPAGPSVFLGVRRGRTLGQWSFSSQIVAPRSHRYPIGDFRADRSDVP